VSGTVVHPGKHATPSACPPSKPPARPPASPSPDPLPSPPSYRALQLLLTEMRIQSRGGLYAAYGAMTVFFFLVLVLLPEEFRSRGFGLIVLLDPAFMGFFFAGGLVLLERDQGVLALIVTHGGGFRSWWRAKTAAIVVLALVVVTILTALSHTLGLIRMTLQGTIFLATGLLLSIPVFFSFGVMLASRYARVLDYFVYAGIVMTPFMIPLVEIVGIPVGPAGALSPVWGTVVFLSSIFKPHRSGLELLFASVSLIVWNLLAYRWARRGFARLAAGQASTEQPRWRELWNRRRRRLSRPGEPEAPDGPSGSEGFIGMTGPGGADVQLLLRDPMMRLILVAPLLVALLLGRGLPFLMMTFLEGDLGSTTGNVGAIIATAVLTGMDAVRSFVILLSAIMYGMVGAFLVLDEKDEGIFPVLRTMPGRPGWYVLRRAAVLIVLYGLLLAILIPVGDLVHGGGIVFAVSMVVDAMLVVLAFLALSILAKNKVQGLAMAKVLNVCSLPPLLLMALPGRPGYLTGLLPSGWGTLMRLRADTPWEAAVLASGGIAYAGVLILLLYRRMLRAE
jgi:fluoroquinolone transport system permease protein